VAIISNSYLQSINLLNKKYKVKSMRKLSTRTREAKKESIIIEGKRVEVPDLSLYYLLKISASVNIDVFCNRKLTLLSTDCN